MSDYVKKTLCTTCIHREICSIKASYLDTLAKIPYICPDFAVTLSCRHYSEVPTLRANMLNTISTINNADGTRSEIKGVYNG